MGFNLQLGEALRSENVFAIDDAIRAIVGQEIRVRVERAQTYPEAAAELFKVGFDAGAREAKADLEVEKIHHAATRQRMDDLKLILRIPLELGDGRGEESRWIEWTDKDATLILGETEDGDPIELRVAMDDGLPCLDEAARVAIRTALRGDGIRSSRLDPSADGSAGW